MNRRLPAPLRGRFQIIGDELVVRDTLLEVSATRVLLFVGFMASMGCFYLAMVYETELLTWLGFLALNGLAVVAVRSTWEWRIDKAPRKIPLLGLTTEIVETEGRSSRSVSSHRTLFAHVGDATFRVMHAIGAVEDYDAIPEVKAWLDEAAIVDLGARRTPRLEVGFADSQAV